MDPEQWLDFAHELCHVLLQYGNQIINLNNLYIQYQEWKANNFALHFCVPTFMLLEYKINTTNEAINIIKNKFYVTDKIAKKRVIHFENQLEWSKIYCKLTNSI
ncbi:ImmA/IrrE family metallo-endopeptidase [Oceanobacillus neutriphilus]